MTDKPSCDCGEETEAVDTEGGDVREYCCRSCEKLVWREKITEAEGTTEENAEVDEV